MFTFVLPAKGSPTPSEDKGLVLRRYWTNACQSCRRRFGKLLVADLEAAENDRQILPVVPENSIPADSRVESESEHHPGRCLHAFSCLGCLSPTCSGRAATLKCRTSFFAISSILL